jgi:hypothetical protein
VKEGKGYWNLVTCLFVYFQTISSVSTTFFDGELETSFLLILVNEHSEGEPSVNIVRLFLSR